MKCDLSRTELEQFLAGALSGAPSRRVRAHLAHCASCAAELTQLERTELLPALDETVQPAEDVGARFHARLWAHRASGRAVPRSQPWRTMLAPLGLSGRLALGGGLAALAVGAVLLQHRQPVATVPQVDTAIAEYLPLYEDMGVIHYLDLLENFDDIEGMADSDAGRK